MSLRLTLEGEAEEAVAQMLSQLKQENPEVSVTPSSLASWAVIHFFKKNFKQSKSKIADSHFNPKAYIRLQLKDLNSVEKVEAALLEIRNKMKNTKGNSERKNDGEPGPTGT
jgi:transcription initiation factor TFIIIB Brf1 subunit/transcription initiation factor TFIIB